MPINVVDIRDAASKARRTVVIDTKRFHSWVHNYIQPGEHDDMHCHNQDQTFIVIDGQCTMHFEDGGHAVLNPGMMVTITGGSFYWIENSGTGPMVMIGNRSGSVKDTLKIDYVTRQPINSGEEAAARRARFEAQAASKA
jgi:mannose-6-phosphate isomerase-like protein (cupin superfamily)